jgi:hypothetical protein
MTQNNPLNIRHIVSPKPELQQCEFYHSIDLSPGHSIQGLWDLRNREDSYLGNVEFAGRSVLEVGPASGYLSFHMERCGADVTALEPPMSHLWDIVPLDGFDIDDWRNLFFKGITRIRNSFWYLHHLKQSKVKLIEADPHAIPEEAGNFDIGVLCAVLLHCRSPFSVLEGLARRTTKTIVVTELYDSTLGDEPLMRLLAQPALRQVDTWWSFTPSFIVNALGILGFQQAHISVHHQLRTSDNLMVPMFTVTAHRPEASGPVASPL